MCITLCAATEKDKGIYHLKIYRGSEMNRSFKYLGVVRLDDHFYAHWKKHGCLGILLV